MLESALLEGYKIFLDNMVQKKKIISFESDIVSEPPIFTVVMEQDAMNKLKKSKTIYKTFALKSNINTTGMYLHDANSVIKKYNNMYYNKY